jgi:hypothetical protein
MGVPQADYWQFGGGIPVEQARVVARAFGFEFEIGRVSRFENARNAVVIGRRDLKGGLVNRIELAEEIQHGLDWATREATRSRYRGHNVVEFHVELFQRIIRGQQAGGFEFLTDADVEAIERIIRLLYEAG